MPAQKGLRGIEAQPPASLAECSGAAHPFFAPNEAKFCTE